MKHSIAVGSAVLLCIAAAACTTVPPPKGDTGTIAKPQPGDTAARAEAVDSGEDRPEVALPGTPGPKGGRRESLTCYSGTEDRHARIGVDLENDEVTYFAFYSKSRPRTCSIAAGRGDSLSRWTRNGARSTVTLPGQRGRLQIEHKGAAYRFVFLDVDRVRYCGMQGKINGSLTVTRGKSSCMVQGVMDGHSS